MQTQFPLSSLRRAALRWGLGSACLGLLLVAAGDARVGAAATTGIDPLQILDLQVKSNVIILLDSSGSMRESLTNSGNATSISAGEFVGDDDHSKLASAKAALTTVIATNASKVNFQFGTYVNSTDAAYGPRRGDRFYYRTDSALAANIGINGTGDGNDAPGISRSTGGSDNFTIGGTTYYYLTAEKFWNGQTVDVADGSYTSGAKTNPATVTLKSGGTLVTFTYQGAFFDKTNANSCDGFQSLVPLQGCDRGDLQIATLAPYLRKEALVCQSSTEDGCTGNDDWGNPKGAGDLAGYRWGGSLNSNPAAQPYNPAGVRSGGYTPIAHSLRDIRLDYWAGGANYYASIAANYTLGQRPRTFVIVLTDGDDTCSTGGTGGYDENAKIATYEAQQLYERLDDDDPASSVSTFFVAYGAGVGVTRSNAIAWGGSGMTRATSTYNGSPDEDGWTTMPADKTGCPTCRDAFKPTSLSALTQALQDAIDLGQSTGSFTAAPSITDNVYEFVKGAAGCLAASGGIPDADNPETRYKCLVPVRFGSSFALPGWVGHLTAFRADSTTASVSTGAWASTLADSDAGKKLLDLVQGSLGTPATPTAGAARQSYEWKYAQLTGAVPTTLPFTPATGAGVIRRRIFTTTRNDVFAYAADVAPEAKSNGSALQRPYLLWPNAATDTTLDTALGLNAAATVAAVQALVPNACANVPMSPVPTGTKDATYDDCVSGTVAGARNEARRIMLASLAGAETYDDSAGNLRRDPVTGQLFFRAKTSILADSTRGTPAVAGPPPDGIPGAPNHLYHSDEYLAFRDGLTNGSAAKVNGIDVGLGLRNPDKGGNAANVSDPLLKPVMTVVYLPANDGLHAFRAGPSAGGSTGCTPSATKECGGEELWSFLPFDQLGKLPALLNWAQQTRDTHVYTMAASVRVADVFVPVNPAGTSLGSVSSVAIPGTGKWRTLLFVGRGIGGKSLTALDITAPGPFTRPSLETNVPGVLWNRGNPDTVDGAGGTKVHDDADVAAYATMGQTWSTPAVARVPASTNVTARKTAGVEFVLYAGSGYESSGAVLYTLDALTGDVVRSVAVPDRSGEAFTNAFVAPPAGYAAEQLLTNGLITSSGGSLTTKVFIGDLHGRVWKFRADSTAAELFADLGSDQPVAEAVGLLSLNSDSTGAKPHVYVESGEDSRVAPPGPGPSFNKTPPFYMWGLRDSDNTTDPNPSDVVNGTADLLFRVPFLNNPAPGFRGTSQPATAITCSAALDASGNCSQGTALGRAFFVGTQYTPLGSGNCSSQFDSIVYALGAATGQAAYALPDEGGLAKIYTKTFITGVEVSHGVPTLDQGLGTGATKPPAPPAVMPPNAVPPANVLILDQLLASRVCR